MARDLVGMAQVMKTRTKIARYSPIHRLLCIALHSLHILMYKQPTDNPPYYPHKILLQKTIPLAFNKIQRRSFSKEGIYRNYL